MSKTLLDERHLDLDVLEEFSLPHQMKWEQVVLKAVTQWKSRCGEVDYFRRCC